MHGHITIGEHDIFGTSVGLLAEDRLRHMHVISATGAGKSTLILHMLREDFAAGRGIILIDPHGDLAEAALDLIPRSRTDDLCYFNAADCAWPLGFNPLEQVAPERRHLVRSGFVHTCKAIWGQESWGPRLEHVLNRAVAALLEIPGSTLLGIPRLLEGGP